MKLIEALQRIRSAREIAATRRFALATGFTPLHLGTFLTAHLQGRLADRRVDLGTGLFGDLVGNVRRAVTDGAAGLAVVVEWADVDRRLGLRESGGWGPGLLPDILETAAATLGRLAGELATAAATMPVAVMLPTLPLPPIAFAPGTQAGAFELQLRLVTMQFAAGLASHERIRIANERWLDTASPLPGRLSVKSALASGLPYDAAHADAVADQLARLLLPPSPKKGLLTDLDDTLWLGILGEVGVAGVAWDLEHHAQVHGLYQQCVAAFADSGVLVAVMSKNDESLVEEAFRRPDLILPRDRVFPLLAGWGAKSKGVETVLAAWNVGADSLVFVDDSPIEIAEVQSRYPEVECRLFPKHDPDAVLALLHELRDLFGRPTLQAEDALRRDSLRSAEAFRQSAASADHDDDAFVTSLDATVTLAIGESAADARALELVNKTNQFNLNGLRYLEADWAALQARASAVVVTASYADKFGPLGKIAVLTGAVDGDRVLVERWVMSCRAFARRIEHVTLQALFDTFDVETVALEYAPTPRNTPLREFLATLVDLPDEPGTIEISRAHFARVRPTLHHRVERATLAETTHE